MSRRATASRAAGPTTTGGGKGRLRGDSTVEHNRERVRGFGAAHTGRPLRSIGRREARSWANAHPGTVPALRAMFNDALEDGLCAVNPFAKLGLDRSKGREDIVVLTRAELDALAQLARRMNGERFGREVAALILWAAYTRMRPGETFAARFSLLDGDTYDLRRQFNSTLGRETVPKHNSSGMIYVPEPVQRAVLDKPRRLGDDLIFRSNAAGSSGRRACIARGRPCATRSPRRCPTRTTCASAWRPIPRTGSTSTSCGIRRQLHAQRPGARAVGDRRATAPLRRRRARPGALRAPRPHGGDSAHPARLHGRQREGPSGEARNGGAARSGSGEHD